jgi:hypothetical protein
MGWISQIDIPPWVWWSAAIVVLFANNVALTYELRARRPERPDIPAVTAFRLIWHRSRRAAELVRRRDELLNLPQPLEHHMTATARSVAAVGRRNEKPRPTWERGPGLSLGRVCVAYSVRMLSGSQRASAGPPPAQHLPDV